MLVSVWPEVGPDVVGDLSSVCRRCYYLMEKWRIGYDGSPVTDTVAALTAWLGVGTDVGGYW